MSAKRFFVDTLTAALDLGIATPDDVLRHAGPEVLAMSLPRPLWARLLTAALGAPRLDAQLVVETIGVPNLCEHVPSPIIWACIAEIAQRALAGAPVRLIPKLASAPAVPRDEPLVAAPPPEARRDTPPRGAPVPLGPAIPRPSDAISEVVAALESDERAQVPAPGRARTPTGPRLRQAATSVGRLGNGGSRRPQAQAEPPAAPSATGKPARRGQTEADAYDVEADAKDEWKNALAVEDEQLVDWTASEETQTTGEEYGKR